MFMRELLQGSVRRLLHNERQGMKRNGKSKKEDKRKSVEQVMGHGRVFLYLCLSGAERAVLCPTGCGGAPKNRPSVKKALLTWLTSICPMNKDPKRKRRFFPSTPLPYLAIHLKKAIIRNRWKLKSRRDLKVLAHFQARAGEQAPTRNRLSTTTFLLYNAARLCTSKVHVLRVKRV